MPLFSYLGPEGSVSIAGRHLDRGIPTILEGRAADIARERDDFEEHGAGDDKPKAKAATKPDATPKATRTSTRKATATKSTRPTKAAPSKSEPATPIVSSTDPTPTTETIDVSTGLDAD